MNLRALRVFLSNEPYVSISRTAHDYQQIVRKLCQAVDDPYEADVALLNQSPTFLAHLLHNAPALQNAYVIGYFVWESDQVPAEMLTGIAMADEIWTPSAYCHELFSRVHPRVIWMPHVVERDARFDPDDAAFWDGLLPSDADGFNAFNFFTIARHHDLRKNLALLEAAFHAALPHMPNARLIIKDQPGPRYKTGLYVQGPVVRVVGNVSFKQINALYDRAHVYVSAHCSEGWGLPLSDAMLLGKPVVATAYSGNMDFMTPHNALLVPASEEPIRAQDAYYLFAPPMRWGYAHREALEAQLIAAYQQTQSGAIAPRVTQARNDVKLYDRTHLTLHMKQRLRSIASGLQDKSFSRVGQRSF